MVNPAGPTTFVDTDPMAALVNGRFPLTVTAPAGCCCRRSAFFSEYERGVTDTSAHMLCAVRCVVLGCKVDTATALWKL